MKSTRFTWLCRSLIVAAVLLVLDCAAHAQPSVVTNSLPRAIPRRASIILIVADGLGYGDLSCYGQTKFLTPNLDKLAAEGIRFTNYYSGAKAESPAWATLMLGEDSSHIRQRADADIPLAPDELTVAQVLKNSGYYTGWIGEWNLGGETTGGAPWRKGFDQFAGYFDENDARNSYADYMWRYAPKSIFNQTNHQMDTFAGRETLMPNLGGAKGEYIPDLLTKAAANFIRINEPDAANHYRPFFLVLHYNIPGDGRSEVPTDAPFSEEPWPQPAKNRAAMISQLDGYIAQLQQQLQQLDMTNNTAVFFTSATVPPKNGAVNPNYFHSVISTNDLRVPMIVRWPERIPAGVVSGHKWSAEDFLPTAAAIGFVAPPKGINGTSVFPVLTGQEKK